MAVYSPDDPIWAAFDMAAPGSDRSALTTFTRDSTGPLYVTKELELRWDDALARMLAKDAFYEIEDVPENYTNGERERIIEQLKKKMFYPMGQKLPTGARRIILRGRAFRSVK